MSYFDVRILTFEKEKVILDNVNDSKGEMCHDNDNFSNRYMSSHYYDFFEFSKVETDSNRFMHSAYEKIKSIRENKKNSQYVVQQCIVLYKSVDKEDDITKHFWDNEASHIFISMIKLSKSDNKTFTEVKEKICAILSNKLNNNCFILYHSFDFSDLFLLVKNANSKIFQELLWKINYSLDSKNKLIKDTITLFGIHQMCLNDISNSNDLEQFKTKNSRNHYLVNNSINVQISFGVQDVTILKDIIEYIEKKKYYCNSKIGSIFGRRDVSIDLYNIEIFEAVKLYNKIKQISKETKDSARMFISLKTISSVSIKNQIDDIKKQIETINSSNLFTKSIETIVDLANQYQELTSNRKFMEISEILLSIKELTVNCFSEEFLISIYYSFFVFLKISIKMITDGVGTEDIGKFQREYFSSINMMSHCTMHGEKCFIQAAPFNPLLFDVPPRLLAFYTSVSYMVCQELQQDDQQLFSFLFVPGFRDSINVRLISTGNDKDNRLLVVDCKEKMLYDPYRAISIIIHEIAHFVGNETRCRKSRLHYILSAIATLFFVYNYPKRGIYDYLEAIIAEYECKIIRSVYNAGDNDEIEFYLSALMNYFEKNSFMYWEFSTFGSCPKNLELRFPLDDYIDRTNAYYQYMLNMSQHCKKQDDHDLYKESISKMIQYELYYNSDFSWKEQYIRECYQVIGSFREAYADLILIQFIKIELNQYVDLINEELKTYDSAIKQERLTYDDIFNMHKENKINLETALRVSAIYHVCYDNTDFSGYKDLDNDLDRVVFDGILNNLIHYLYECLNKFCNKPNFGKDIKNIVDNLNDLSEETIYSIHHLIFEYKTRIDEEMSKQ